MEHTSSNSDSAPLINGKISQSSESDALAVLKRLRESGHEAYFAGGCVRDLLLNRIPKDWDVATDAPPVRVRTLFSNSQAVGASFGVILVRQRKTVVEVATFRADAEYVDGRHPVAVRFTSAMEDAQRRDFTINGLFLDPLKPGPLEEKIIDYVGGRADLAAGLIRAIGDPEARFREDHLRMLRAVRFAARLGFAIEPETKAAIAKHAPELIRISPERIAEELRAMLTPSTRNNAYRLLEQLKLRRDIFRFLEFPKALVGVNLPGNEDARDDTGSGLNRNTISVFELLALDHIPFGLALAGASVDHFLWTGAANSDVRRLFQRPVAQKIVRALRQSLKISNDDSDDILNTLEGLDSLLQESPPTTAILKRFLARPAAALSRELLGALNAAGLLNRSRVEWLQSELRRWDETDFAPPPLITGDDLTAAGLAPGPRFKKILDAVYDAQLENRVGTREQAMTLALSS